MSLTDEIYTELMDGLQKGLDWQHFLAKYGASKEPLYNALGLLQRGLQRPEPVAYFLPGSVSGALTQAVICILRNLHSVMFLLASGRVRIAF